MGENYCNFKNIFEGYKTLEMMVVDQEKKYNPLILAMSCTTDI